MGRRFVRRSADKVMGGVCSGIAAYVGADVTLVRLITLFGILASGVLPGVFIYIICVIIVPLDIHTYPGDDANGAYGLPSDNSRYVIGIVLIAAGVYLFARMFFAWLDWRYVFAGLLIIGGLAMLFGSKRGN